MWKVFKFFGWLIKAMLWLALLLFIGGVACLYIAERGLPDALVQNVAERLSSLSSDELVFRIDRITYSVRRGLTVHRFKAFPKRITERAFVSAEEVAVDFTLFSFAPLRDRVKCVTLKGLDFPELPPRPPRGPDAPKPPSVAHEINVALPEVAPFELILERPNILGLQAERVSATVASTPGRASATDLRVAWPERLGDVGVAGEVAFDAETKRIIAKAQGRTFPHLITPLLLSLRAKGVVKQMDCFQDFTTPIAVDYTVDLDLTRGDYAMTIGIDVRDCTYRGVPISHAQGAITVTDTNSLVIADIALTAGELKSGALSGRVVYRDDNDSVFIDAQGILPKPDLLAIINVLNNGELDMIQCETPVSVSAKGIVATNLKKTSVTNDLNAVISFAKGSVLHIPLTDTSCDLKVYAQSALAENIKGSPVDGGKLGGYIHFAFPDYAASNTTFVVSVTASGADFSNLMCIAQTNNTVTGKVTGKVSLAGIAAGRVLTTLEGDGSLKVEESILARIPLFAGLTGWLANNIPGVSSVVNQSSAKLDFTMTNGVAVTENMVVEGNVFSIRCKGNCTLDTGAVSMVARMNILKEQTLAGQIARIITFPITRTLLEFRLSGTVSNPEWSYIHFIEKITDAFF